jgi:hypothetical protein
MPSKIETSTKPMTRSEIDWNLAKHTLQKQAKCDIFFFLDCCHVGAGNLRPYGLRGQRKVNFLGAVSGAGTPPSKYHKKYDSFISRTVEVIMVPDTHRPGTTEELNDALQSLSLVKGLPARKSSCIPQTQQRSD